MATSAWQTVGGITVQTNAVDRTSLSSHAAVVATWSGLAGPADPVHVVRACGSVAETCPAGDDVEPKAKRAKNQVHSDCVRFYWDHCDVIAKRNKRSRAHCLRNLKEAPEVYGKVHKATPARWKRSKKETHKKDTGDNFYFARSCASSVRHRPETDRTA